MAIFDSTVFFKDGFTEQAVFTANAYTTPVAITVVVNRDTGKEQSRKNSNIQTVSYPLTVDIKKSDVATITPSVNKLTIKNSKYIDEEFLIKAVVLADEFIWRVAL